MDPENVNKIEASAHGVEDSVIESNELSVANIQSGRNKKRKRSKEEKFEELRKKLSSNDRFKVEPGEKKRNESWTRRFSGYLVNTKGLRVVKNLFCLVCYFIERKSEFVGVDELREVAFYEEGTANSNISHHLIHSHGFIKENQPYNNKLFENVQLEGRQGEIRSRRTTTTQQQFIYLLTLLIVCCHLSIDLVDHVIFRRLLAAIAPQYSVPPRQTLSSTHIPDVWSFYYLKVYRLITETEFRSLFISTDIWLCKPNQVSFICFNGHFFSESHNRVLKTTLKFQELPSPHNHQHIFELVTNLIKEFRLEGKRLVFNSDEGPNIVSALSKFERLSCIGHILHNLVADWFKLDPNFRRILKISKDIIHFFRFHFDKARDYYSMIDRLADFQELEDAFGSVLNEERFESEYSNYDLDQQVEHQPPTQDAVDQANGEQTDQQNSQPAPPVNHQPATDQTSFDKGKPTKATKFPKDCITRWNMKHAQLNSVLRHKDCVIKVLQTYLQHELLPSEEDWAILRDYVDLLLHIKSISEELSSDEPNASLVISCKAELELKIDSNESLDETLKGQLKNSLNRRWKINDDYIAAALLDPLFKDGRSAEIHLEKRGVTKKQFLLQYAERYNLKPLNLKPEHQARLPTSSFSRSNLSLRESGREAVVSNDCIDDYFSYTPTQCDRDMDLLTWWNINKTRYPFVYLLARELFAMRTTQVSSESTFSKSGLRMLPNRSNTGGRTLEKMVFVETNRKLVEEICANDKQPSPVAEIDSANQQSAKQQPVVSATHQSAGPAALPSVGSCEQQDLSRQAEQLNSEHFDRAVDYSHKLKKLKSVSAKKEVTDAKKKQAVKSEAAKSGEITGSGAGQSDQLVEDAKAARIRELKAAIESKMVGELEEKEHEAANDEFTELAILEPTYQIGPQKHDIVCINKFIGNFEIVACMESEIMRLHLTDCLVLHGELLTNDNLLIQRLNEAFHSGINRIFLPVNFKDIHWFLLYLDLEANRSIIVDSDLKEESAYVDTFKQAFRLLQAVFILDSRMWRTEKHRFTIIRDPPQQPAGSVECGVFCFNYFQRIVDPVFDLRRFEIHPNFRRYEMNRILSTLAPVQKRETRQSKRRTGMLSLSKKDLKNLEEPDVLIVYLDFVKI